MAIRFRKQGDSGGLTTAWVIWAVTFVIVGLLQSYVLLFTSVDPSKCQRVYLGARGEQRRTNCFIWEHWKQHQSLLKFSIVLVLAGGIGGGILWYKDESASLAMKRARKDSESRRRLAATSAKREAMLPAFVSTVAAPILPTNTVPPTASVPELILKGVVGSADGVTWWVAVPPASESKFRVICDVSIPIRILIGQDGKWVQDLGVVSLLPFETSVVIPHPNACIHVIPVNPNPGIAVGITVEIDLPGEVIMARELV